MMRRRRSDSGFNTLPNGARHTTHKARTRTQGGFGHYRSTLLGQFVQLIDQRDQPLVNGKIIDQAHAQSVKGSAWVMFSLM